MKKIILLAILGLVLTTSVTYAADNVFQIRDTNIASKEATMAQRDLKVASRTANITQKKESISQDLKQRAQREINRRINFLNQLSLRLNEIKKLSVAEKTDLQNQIKAQIGSLNALQIKINADTDNAFLKADVKSIVSDYYIFLFFRVKVNLLIAADRLSMTTDNLSAIYTKLQTRVSEAQAQGLDVTNLNTLLSDMNTQILQAKTQFNLVNSELSSLTAQNYPGNKATLEDARAKLKIGLDDLKSAYQDAIKIRQGLQGLKPTTPEASSSGTKNAEGQAH